MWYTYNEEICIEAGDLDEFVNGTYYKFDFDFGGNNFAGHHCRSKN